MLTSEIDRLIKEENKTHYALKIRLELVHKTIENNSRVSFPGLTF